MLHSLKETIGLSIEAKDGEIGSIDDFYFTDDQWNVRYLVVKTGGWFTRRTVVLPLQAVVKENSMEESLRVNLTQQQIKDSPDIDTVKPVSRQQEAGLLDHYGIPFYWPGMAMWGQEPLPGFLVESLSDEMDEGNGEVKEKQEEGKGRQPREEAHLRSFNEVRGYRIQAMDEEAGHVEDFLINESDWSVQLIVVDTGNWLPDISVLVSPERISNIDWSNRRISVNLTRTEVESSPAYDPLNAPFSPRSNLYQRRKPLMS